MVVRKSSTFIFRELIFAGSIPITRSTPQNYRFHWFFEVFIAFRIQHLQFVGYIFVALDPSKSGNCLSGVKHGDAHNLTD
jgi:hypothetical protein